MTVSLCGMIVEIFKLFSEEGGGFEDDDSENGLL